MILKIFPKAGYDLYTRVNWPMTAKESRNRNCHGLTEQSLELVGRLLVSKKQGETFSYWNARTPVFQCANSLQNFTASPAEKFGP